MRQNELLPRTFIQRRPGTAHKNSLPHGWLRFYADSSVSDARCSSVARSHEQTQINTHTPTHRPHQEIASAATKHQSRGGQLRLKLVLLLHDMRCGWRTAASAAAAAAAAVVHSGGRRRNDGGGGVGSPAGAVQGPLHEEHGAHSALFVDVEGGLSRNGWFSRAVRQTPTHSDTHALAVFGFRFGVNVRPGSYSFSRPDFSRS